MDDKKREEIKATVRSEIRKILVEARESAQLTVESAAKLIGCEAETLLKYESGEIQPLRFIQVLKVYGVPDLTAHERLWQISLKISKQR